MRILRPYLPGKYPLLLLEFDLALMMLGLKNKGYKLLAYAFKSEV